MPSSYRQRLACLVDHVAAQPAHIASSAAAAACSIAQQQQQLRDTPRFFTSADAGFELGAPADPAIVSPYAVTEKQRQQWLGDGFCVLDSLLTPSQVQLWRGVLDRAVDERPRRMPLADDPSNSVSTMYTQRCGLRFNHGELNKLVFEMSKVAGEAAARLNSHPAGYRLYLDNVLIKEGWADPTRWHIDTYSFAFNSAKTTSFWISLDDATLQNGCLHFLRGSHHAIAAREDPFVPAPNVTTLTRYTTYTACSVIYSIIITPARESCFVLHSGITDH
eukprot:COSAG05_NODE_901_length_6665_cov_4.080262_4_plen_277_part_00